MGSRRPADRSLGGTARRRATGDPTPRPAPPTTSRKRRPPKPGPDVGPPEIPANPEDPGPRPSRAPPAARQSPAPAATTPRCSFLPYEGALYSTPALPAFGRSGPRPGRFPGAGGFETRPYGGLGGPRRAPMARASRRRFPAVV